VFLVHPQNNLNDLILNCALAAASSLQLVGWYQKLVLGWISKVSFQLHVHSTRSVDLVNGCGIDSKSRHYQNRLMWIMFLSKIHCWSVVTTVSFGSSLLWRLCQILDYPLKLKFFNFQGSGTSCNNLLVPKKSFLVGVQTWPCEGFVSVFTTNHSIKWVLVSIRISISPLSMLILTSYYFATCKVAMPSLLGNAS
jgi:hypothetical protein